MTRIHSGVLALGVCVAIAAAAAAAPKPSCVVCEHPLGGLAAQRFLNGQEVLIHPECSPAFEQNRERYASQMMPNAALFQEQLEMPMPTSGWLYAALYLLAGIVCGGATAYFAVDRGRSGKAWFALGVVVNVAALAILLFLPRQAVAFEAPGLAKVPTTRDPEPCPACGHPNHPASARCLACGTPHAPHAPSEVAAAREGR